MLWSCSYSSACHSRFSHLSWFVGSMFLFHTQSFSSFSVYLLFLTIIFNLVFLSVKALGLAYQKLGMYTAATKVRFLFVPFSYCLTLHSCDFVFKLIMPVITDCPTRHNNLTSLMDEPLSWRIGEFLLSFKVEISSWRSEISERYSSFV